MKPRFKAWYGGACPVRHSMVQVVQRGWLGRGTYRTSIGYPESYNWASYRPSACWQVVAYRVLSYEEVILLS